MTLRLLVCTAVWPGVMGPELPPNTLENNIINFYFLYHYTCVQLFTQNLISAVR